MNISEAHSVEYESAINLLSRHNQLQLLDYYGELDEEKRRILLKDIIVPSAVRAESILPLRQGALKILPKIGKNTRKKA